MRRKLSRIAHFCRAKGRHTPKFCEENFRKLPQNCEIRESFLPRKFSAIRYVFGIHHQNKCTLALETLASWSKLNIFTLSLFLPSSSPASPFSSFSSSSYLRLFLLLLLPPLSPPPSPSPPPPPPLPPPGSTHDLRHQTSSLLDRAAYMLSLHMNVQ